jgi:phosphoglycolate phosphatase/putative hydrolase of the HAD superfamily
MMGMAGKNRGEPKGWIFDVDGTLYDQLKLRRRIFLNILACFIAHPFEIREIGIVSRFRKERERLSLYDSGNLETLQYVQTARVMNINVAEVRKAVGKWIFEKPLPYLGKTRFSGVRELFDELKRQNIPIGIYSEYPASNKLEALGLSADVLVCSTDKDVDCFKPHCKGLHVTARKLGLPPAECIFIGDRDDKDGLCARNAGMPYMILTRKRPVEPDQFSSFNEILRWIST